jgi:DNA repair exonuclease SbcCD ATPase subunit
MSSPAVDFAQGIKTTDSIIGERRQAYDTRNAELAQLETELAQVEAQIAEFDRMNPGIASGDIDFDATMMEAGNYSPYQQAVNTELVRRQMGESAKAGAMSGVWNGIDNARNALAGYAKMSDDQRAVALDLARTELDKAKRAANGSELPREYYDVLAKIDNPDTGDGMNNETYWRNSFTAKVSKNNLHDSDIVELKEYANKNPNKELTAKLYAIVREFEKSTVEAGGRRRQAKAKAKEDAKNFAARTASMTEAERNLEYNSAKASGEKWTNFFKMLNGKLVEDVK